MIDGVAAIIHCVAQDDAQFSRKGVGDHCLALDQAGVAVACFLPCLPPVDENHIAAALLQMQRHAHSHHARPENDYISAGAHPARSPFATRPLAGCGKSGILGPDMGYTARWVTRCGGTSDARWGYQERGAVQLCELRSAGAIGSSLAADPEDCGRGAGCTDGGIREAVRQVRTAVDSS